jgi:hypothetical protein
MITIEANEKEVWIFMGYGSIYGAHDYAKKMPTKRE